jgi:hypothetical protein
MFGLLMLTGTLGYGVAVGSYNQKMIFSFICETRLMPDIEVMSGFVEDAFAELLSLSRNAISPDGQGADKPADKPSA